MRPDEFFEDWFMAEPGERRQLDSGLVSQLRSAPVPGHDDIEYAVPLGILIHEELEKYGTDGDEELSHDDMRLAILAFRAVCDRLGIKAEIPFRDYRSFRTYWTRNGAYGSWQARRDLLVEIFDPIHNELAALEQRSLSSVLADPVSPRKRTGWPAVDTEISELRRHFQNSKTAQDYRNVGQDCVAVTEALSVHVYDPARHLRDGETEPPVANTKKRLERFIEDAVPGPDNAALRKLARAAIELSQDVKHRSTPTRRQAGIAADSVILLANVIRRLDEDT